MTGQFQKGRDDVAGAHWIQLILRQRYVMSLARVFRQVNRHRHSDQVVMQSSGVVDAGALIIETFAMICDEADDGSILIDRLQKLRKLLLDTRDASIIKAADSRPSFGRKTRPSRHLLAQFKPIASFRKQRLIIRLRALRVIVVGNVRMKEQKIRRAAFVFAQEFPCAFERLVMRGVTLVVVEFLIKTSEGLEVFVIDDADAVIVSAKIASKDRPAEWAILKEIAMGGAMKS